MGRDLYADDDLTVRAFHGGIDRGQCVQIGTRAGFVQLDRGQAKAAFSALCDFLVAPAQQRDVASILHFMTPEQMALEIVRLDVLLAAGEGIGHE